MWGKNVWKNWVEKLCDKNLVDKFGENIGWQIWWKNCVEKLSGTLGVTLAGKLDGGSLH